MTLDELSAAVAAETDMSKAAATKALQVMLDKMKESLAGGDKVSISGFGVFERVHREEREGRNPQTGETIKIAASNNIKFKPGKALKDAVN